jgi:hypothetical protein
MTPVGSVIAGQNTSTASALELELPVKPGVSTTHRSSVNVWNYHAFITAD